MTSARHGYVGGQWVAQPAYNELNPFINELNRTYQTK